MMHEVDFRIVGNEMQFVEVELDPGESAVAEAGSMMYMSPAIEMETVFGDGSQQRQGVMGALLGAGKRLITGESLFMTVFTNGGGSKQHVAFAAPYPGKILAMDLSQLGGELARSGVAAVAPFQPDGRSHLQGGAVCRRQPTRGWLDSGRTRRSARRRRTMTLTNACILCSGHGG